MAVMEGPQEVGRAPAVAVKAGVKISAIGVNVVAVSPAAVSPETGRLQLIAAMQRMSRVVNKRFVFIFLLRIHPRPFEKYFSGDVNNDHSYD